MSRMSNQEMADLQILSNGFAGERVGEILVEIEKKIKSTQGNLVWSKVKVEPILGRMLAIAYAKGYADAVDRIGPKKLLL